MTRSRQTADWGSRAGLAKIVPSSITVGSGTGSATALGTVTFSGASSIAMDNVFSSTYDNYMINIKMSSISAADADIQFYLRSSTPTDITSGYQTEILTQAHTAIAGVAVGTGWIGATTNVKPGFDGYTFHLYSPFLTTHKSFNSSGHRMVSGGTQYQVRTAGFLDNTTSCTGIKIYASTGNFTGTMIVYGYTQ